MRISHLVWREIAHRKLNFLLSVLVVVVAVAGGVGLVTLMRGQEVHTQERVKALDSEIRKITKNMGFNILILPRDQNLADFYAEDFAARTMPEDYVNRLAESKDVMTVQHLRPALVQKLEWPEARRQIILMGVKGVVPFLYRDNKKPLAQPVPQGKLDIGHVLATQLALEPGDTTTLLGEEFTVNRVYPARGDKDDITVWMDLPQAQTLLSKQGEINLIQALECNCESVDRLAEIDAEISGVLGSNVQVIEIAGKAIARAKARTQVAAEGERALANWKRWAAVAIPLATVAAGVIVALLSLANVRQRRQEIGIFRAIGVRSGQILAMILTKAVLIGLAGAALGYVVGFGVAAGVQSSWQESAGVSSAARLLFVPTLLFAVILLTPILTALAGWLPAFAAASQDPAEVLHEE